LKNPLENTILLTSRTFAFKNKWTIDLEFFDFNVENPNYEYFLLDFKNVYSETRKKINKYVILPFISSQFGWV